jgi:hypothetical protein
VSPTPATVSASFAELVDRELAVAG